MCESVRFERHWFYCLKPFFEKEEVWKTMGDFSSSPIRVLVELLSIYPSWGWRLDRPGGFECSVSVKRAKLFAILFEIALGAGVSLEVFLPALLEGVEYLEEKPKSVLFSRNIEAKEIEDDFERLKRNAPFGMKSVPLVLNREPYSALRTLWNIWWNGIVKGDISWLKYSHPEILSTCESLLCPSVLSFFATDFGW